MIIRRVRRSEIPELKALCYKDKQWSKYYSSHELWLNRAIEDMESNNRVVFGVYETKNYADNFIPELIACLFLKKSKFDNIIEFKNLIISNPINDVALDYFSITNKLIDKATKFCEVRGVTAVEVELPQEEHNLINIFLNKGFRIAALRERYLPGNLVCILEKTMGYTYQGDPFDTIKFSKWFLNCYLPCNISEPNYSIDKSPIFNINFTLKPSAKIFDRISRTNNDILQNGKLWVLEDDSDINDLFDDFINNSTIHIKILLDLTKSNNSIIIDTCQKNGVTYFSKLDAIAIAGGDESSLYLPFELDNIGGALTVLEYETIIEYSKKDSITYYLLSGLHSGLSVDYENKEPIYLFIYCPNWENKFSGIIGYSIIEEIERPRFSDLIKSEIPRNSALSFEDLKFYKTYSENENIAKLTCSKIQLFDKPLTLNDEKINLKNEIKQYIEKEILFNGNNSTYLDFHTCNLFIEAFSKKNIFIETNKHNRIITNLRDLPVVVILTALKEEFQAVESFISDKKTIQIHNSFYEEGLFKWNNQTISKIIIRECGQKNIEAAIDTDRAIQNFKPDLILFVGIAGSRKPQDFSIGDVIFPHKIYSYEGGKSSRSKFCARPDLEYSSFYLQEIARQERRGTNWYEMFKTEPKKQIKADLGVIASGEKLIEDYDSEIGEILNTFYEETSAVEMEGFGFAKAVNRRVDKINYGIIRGISDILNIKNKPVAKNKRSKDSKKLASENASVFAFWLIYKFFTH